MKYPGVKALTFDVGGTVFDWRGTIEAELLGCAPDEVMMVAAHANDLKGAKNAGLKTAYVHRGNDWWRGFPTDEPTLRLETFDVSASDFDGLVEKLT